MNLKSLVFSDGARTGDRSTYCCYKITDDDKYLHEARLAANALLVPIEEKWSAYLNNGDNGIWFEEYAKKLRTTNGFKLS